MTARQALATVGVAATALVVAACGNEPTSDNPRTVTVVGTGEAVGVPDTLRADIGVQATGPDVSAALNAANAAIEQVTTAVVGAGVERSDIRTQQVSLSPSYTEPVPGSVSEVAGYDATNSLAITIRGVDRASEVLSAAAEAGGDATRINNVSFSIDDDTELRQQAREAAFGDAKDRGEQYAQLSGDDLGQVITIVESGAQTAPPSVLSRESSADISAVPIEPGEQTLGFTVTVTFALS